MDSLDVVIRPLPPQGLDELVELWRALAVEGAGGGPVLYPPTDENAARWRRWVAEAAERGDIHILVAICYGHIVGYVLFGERRGPLDSPYRRGVIHDLYVKPGWRGKGLGTRLLEEALTCLRLSGINVVTVGVAAGNEGALRLYRKLGFKPFMLTLLKWLRPSGQ